MPDSRVPPKAYDEWSDLVEEFSLSLSNAGRSARTLEAYRYALDSLQAFGNCKELGAVSPGVIERWLADCRTRVSPANADFVYRSARPFFRWSVMRGYLAETANPFSKVSAPRTEAKVVEVLSDGEVLAVLAACSGFDWRSRRDLALIRVLLDTGLRRGEIAGLQVDELDLPLGIIRVRAGTSKTRRERSVAIGVRTRQAVRAWLRARQALLSRTGYPDRGALWLGYRGEGLSVWGVFQTVQRRVREAGVTTERAVHVWRHSWATRALDAGAAEGDLMTLGGWRSSAMLARYTASNRQERALRASSAWLPGDRL